MQTEREKDIIGDHGYSGYSTCGSSMRDDSNTDSDVENHKETIFSEGYNSESDEANIKNTRGLMDNKVNLILLTYDQLFVLLLF